MVVDCIDLSPMEASQWRGLADQFTIEQDLIAVRNAIDLAVELPPRLRDFPRRLHSGGSSKGIALIRGVPLGDTFAVPTPRTLSTAPLGPEERGIERLMLVLAGVFGTPFSFASQQAGRLILDIFPVRGQETGQLGSSSKAMLEWHVEHAFHPRRAHYILLLCLRNHQRVATRYAFAADLKLTPDVVYELRRPQFVALPDESHSESYNAAIAGTRVDNGTFSNISAMAAKPQKIPVLEGDGNLMISVDFPYMPAALHSDKANAALLALREAIEEAAESVVLGSGELLVLDNRRGVHARDEFIARYDGTDRWLKQLSVGTRTPSYSPNEYDLRIY